MKKRILKYALPVGAVLLIASLIPYSTQTTPAWTVSVLDAAGKPIPSVEVTQSWRNEALEDFLEEKKKSDGSGSVNFPERRAHASFLTRTMGILDGLLVREGSMAQNYVSFEFAAPSLKKENDNFPKGTPGPGGALLLSHQMQPFDLFRDVQAGDDNYIVQELYEHPEGVEARDTSGNTLLHAAMNTPLPLRLSMSASLLLAGVKVNASNNNGETPLHVAVRKQDLDYARWLMAHGARIDLPDKKGQTPLQAAQALKNEELEKALTEPDLQ